MKMMKNRLKISVNVIKIIGQFIDNMYTEMQDDRYPKTYSHILPEEELF
jgi:hypothetical protein